MTSPTTSKTNRQTPIEPTERKTAGEHAQTFLDWTTINSKALTIGAAVIVLAAIGFWFWGRSRQIQEANAQRALLNAKQSLSSGNMQLAQTDLQSVYSRYGSTEAGVEAAMLLATISYDNNKPQDGISLLEKTSGSSAAAMVQGTIRSLEGDGYAQMGKLTDAAKQYEQAASATTYPLEKGFYLSKAARAYQAAGDTAKSRQIWTALMNDPASAMATEAKVRLGELEAQTAKR
ncbi:MAG TPA: tetratricopeptide repeat protein [Gemmatimonadaceae bacterium]|jgi:predicted negative regulator of RcsB-dependent stress response